MKSKIKQILSIVMTVSMLSTMVPLTTYGADFTDDGTGAQSTVEVPAQNDVSAEEPDSDAGSAQTPDVSAGDQDDISSGDEDPFTTDEDTFSTGEEPDVFSDDAANATATSLEDLYKTNGNTAPQLDTSSLYKIVFLDCGRKYFSVSSIEQIIDNAADAGFNYVELGIGNDGLRLLLDDMELTVNGKTYTSDEVKSAIQEGNSKYYNFGTNELTETEMTNIISYANGKGLGIIPLVNTPGHMDAILSAANTLTGVTCSYNGSARTIDVTNPTAVEFTQAIVQKYIDYFSAEGCKFFNMGADEYANDKYTTGSMGFGNLQNTQKYSYYVNYVNKMADMIKGARMTPMAFNDGIYFNNEKGSGTFDTSIVINYWSSGWNGYTPRPAADLIKDGFNLINTSGTYYWVLGKNDWQCDAEKAKGFNYKNFQYKENDPQTGDGLNSLGGMFCIWCDYPGNGSEQQVINATKDTITAFGKTMAVADDILTTPTPEPDTTPTPGATETKSITVSVGSTYELIINGVNYFGETYTTDAPSIATVTVTGTDGSAADYDSSKVWLSTLTNNKKDNYQATGYYCIYDGSYYPLYAKYVKGSQKKTTYYLAAYLGNNTYKEIKNSSSNEYVTVYSLNKEAVLASTTVTFNGVSIGTTTVTIGNTTYTINVVAEDLSKVTPQRVELWITNYGVKSNDPNVSATEFNTGDGSRPKGYYVNVNAASVYGEKGSTFEALVPSTGEYEWSSELVYWKGTCLSSSNKQTAAAGVDQTANGSDFQYIRYWNQEWEISANSTDWTPINNTDQIVAYYLQKTKVTKEIDTLVKDWGSPVGEGDSNPKVGLSVGVVYPDGTVSPNETDIYKNCTTLFNYWDDRDIGIVAPLNNSDYTISKITVTNGTYSGSYTNVWTSSGTINWDKTKNEAGVDYYDETVVWEESDNTTPMVNGATANIKWSGKDNAKLVLIYLKPIKKDTNLNLVYWDDNSDKEIVNTQIVTSYQTGQEAPTYVTSLIQKSDVHVGEITLDNNAYVVNNKGVNQTINKQISTIPNVADKYKSGLYEYIKAVISEDGKTLTLHYNIDSTKLKYKYVIDFGLPLTIPLSDLVEETKNIKSVEFKTISNGTAEYISDDKSIKYTPSSVLEGIVTIPVVVTYDNGDKLPTINVAIYPATTVYYEEGFASFNDKYEENERGSKGTGTQITEKLDQHIGNYGGYDKAYESNEAESSGDAAKVNEYGAEASFSFVGTGVDIYLNCTKTTSPTFVRIMNNSGNLEKYFSVDTKIGAGTSGATEEQNKLANAYSTPIVSVTNLSHGTHKVYITQIKSNESGRTGLSFDGFRVYNTLNTSNEYPSEEQNPQYLELRNKVLANVETNKSKYVADIRKETAQVLATTEKDIAAVMFSSSTRYTKENLQDLLDNGPKNEVYLYPGDKILFNLKKDAQIGLKGVDGSTNYTLNETSGGTLQTTDMFYKVSAGDVTITNTGENVLSITKIKYFGSTASTQSLFGEISEEALTATLLSMGYAAESTSETPTPIPTEKPVKLSAPKLGKVVSASYNSVKVTWSKVKNADGYRVYMKENGKWKYVARVASNSYTRKGLETGKKYTFTVRAYKKTSNGLVLSAYDKKGISGKPELSTPVLSSAKRSASGVTFTWKKTAGATGYVVYRKVNNGAWRAVMATSSTTYKDTTAKKGVKYTYTVRAYRKTSAGNVYGAYDAKGISVK